VHAALRLGAGRYAGLHSEKIMDECLVIVAAPALVKKHGRIKALPDLGSVPFIQSDDQDFAATTLSAALTRPVRGGTFLDDSASVLTAAIVGAGYALTRWSLAARSVHSGALLLASDLTLPYRYAYFLVMPPAYQALPKLQYFRDWLRDNARAFAAPRP
jgi:LysR family glycine cleavage system transcriptional activator